MMKAVRWLRRAYRSVAGPVQEAPSEAPDPRVPEIVLRPSSPRSVPPAAVPDRPRLPDGTLIPRTWEEVPVFNGMIECPSCFAPWGEDEGFCGHRERERAMLWEAIFSVDFSGFPFRDDPVKPRDIIINLRN